MVRWEGVGSTEQRTACAPGRASRRDHLQMRTSPVAEVTALGNLVVASCYPGRSALGSLTWPLGQTQACAALLVRSGPAVLFFHPLGVLPQGVLLSFPAPLSISTGFSNFEFWGEKFQCPRPNISFSLRRASALQICSACVEQILSSLHLS